MVVWNYDNGLVRTYDIQQSEIEFEAHSEKVWVVKRISAETMLQEDP